MFKIMLYGVTLSIDVNNGFTPGNLVVGKGGEKIKADIETIRSSRGYRGHIIRDRCSPVDLVSALGNHNYSYQILEGQHLLDDKDPLPPNAIP